MNHLSFRSEVPADEFCGTTYAAKMLGISVGTVHALVESGELQAWKTKGGHRRISKKTIVDYQIRNQRAVNPGIYGDDKFRVVVATKDETTLAMMRANFLESNSKLDFVFFDSAIHMQLELQTMRPLLLMLDYASLETIGGFEWLRALRSHPLYKHITLVLLCEKEANTTELQGKALSYQIKVLELPVDVAWLKGYLDAVLH